MGFIRNVKTSIDEKSSMSVNSVNVLISAVISFILGLVMAFVLVYDVISNGYIKTSLVDAGLFMLMSGGYVASSGIPKAIVDSKLKTRSWLEAERMNIEAEEDLEDYKAARKRKRKEADGDEEASEDEV